MSGRQEKPALTVPKFSSFKPKQPDPPAPTEIDAKKGDRADRKRHRHSRHEEHQSKRSRQDTELRESRSHRESGRSHTEKGSQHAVEKNDRRGAQSSRSTIEHPRPSEVARTQAVKSDHFFIDLKGDPLIIRYGGIERSKIPAYRRHGYGRVLGTPGRLIIHRDGARDRFSLVMPGESAAFRDKDGLRSKSGRAKRNPILLRPRKGDEAEANDDGYLALGSSKGDRRFIESDSDSEGPNAKPDYRSIEGKAKPHAGAALDSGSDSEESESDAEPPSLELTNPLKWHSIQLSRRVKDHPEDTAAWMELADHQDALLRAGESLDHQVWVNEVHSYTEIKVSMLEKAILHASDTKLRLEALNYLMREGLKVWNTKKAEQRWSEVFKQEGEDNFDLWRLYLDFSMTNIASFKVDDIKTMILDKLGRVIARAGHDATLAFGQATYLFLRATRFLHDAGYRELAVAAWQAMLEMTFFRPAGLDDTTVAMEMFEEFWESEVARTGEQDALGWRRFVETPGDAPEPAVYNRPELEETKDSYKAWANEEKWQAERARLPARTLEHGNDDDPFRVVMFSDIAPLLFLIPDQCLPRLGSQLLDGFLIFLGLPPHSDADEWTAMAWQDPFLTNFEQGWPSQRQEYDGQDTEPGKRTPNFSPAIMRAANTPALLFPGAEEGWFQWLPRQKGQLASPSVGLAKNALCQLVQSKVPTVQDNFSLYYLSLQFLQDPSGVKKLARSLMKQNPTNLALYNGYALAEHVRGNDDVARTVLSSATDLASKTASRSSTHELQLWITWSWMELQLGGRNLAVKRLCSWADDALRRTPDKDTFTSSTYLLKAHQSLKGDFQHLCSIGDVEGAALRAECLVLLAYLTTEGGDTEPSSSAQGNISAAMTTLESSIADLRSRHLGGGSAHERLVQSAARLLYLHAGRGPYRRGYLREQLSAWIRDFPRNTILLSLLDWTDSGLRVVDETRSLLHDRVLVKPHDCVSSRVFAIEHELTRGNVHTAQLAYERAVTSDAAKHNACLWVAYIQFCYGQRSMRARAKEVFYRALRHCPWSREVMMEAFGSLIRVMESEELKSVFAMMSSKGLRIHVDMDEFLEVRRAERSAHKGTTTQ